ncbi:MAG: MazG family protein [Acidimicrobiales bacterium]|nr:MazG family protein [Acidimicrobiales bacterium]
MTTARVVVVGLGPGGPDLVTAGTLDAIGREPVRFLRTRRHPSAEVVPGAATFDAVYDEAAVLDAVYLEIVERLVDAATVHGSVLYAVPGSPVVAERSVELLVADPRVEVEILPALSFLDLAWARLGLDPVAAGVRVVDGHRFAVEAAGERGPLLVAQCDSPTVLSEVKLALDAGLDPSLGPDAEVVVLRRLGLPDETVQSVRWTEIDRVDADHLTSVLVPELAAPIAREVTRFVELVAALRAGCPWDREQTHESLRRHLLEEAYEVLDAIDHLDVETGTGFEHLEEELGDLLFQVLFHSQLAAEEGRFTLADVAGTVHDKLRSRHPHVFGDVEVSGPDEVVRNWEELKKAEKGRDSVFDGIPESLPALALATKVAKKSATLRDAGVDVPVSPDLDDALDGVDHGADEDAFGALLWAVVERARAVGVDPENALRTTTARRRSAAATAEAATAD